MYSVTDLKKNTLVELGGAPYRVVEYQHSKLGRGGAVARTKLRNLKTGNLVSKTFKGNEKVRPAHVDSLNMQYLYSKHGRMFFMEPENFEQLEANENIIGDKAKYLTEGAIVNVVVWQSQIVGLSLPKNIKRKVVSTEPAVRGDTTTTALKKARIEGGAVVNVPLFIKNGDVVLIDTHSGSYKGRA